MMISGQQENYMSAGSNIVHVTDQDFQQQVAQSEQPVLVDFWAEWCGPCNAIAPILEEAANEYQGRLKVVKINVDDNGQTAARLGVRGIPALMLFKNGQVAGQKIGAIRKAELTAFVESKL